MWNLMLPLEDYLMSSFFIVAWDKRSLEAVASCFPPPPLHPVNNFLCLQSERLYVYV